MNHLNHVAIDRAKQNATTCKKCLKKNSLAGNPHLVGHSHGKIDRHVAVLCVCFLASSRNVLKTRVCKYCGTQQTRKKSDDDDDGEVN
jgi:hypothetical protein